MKVSVNNKGHAIYFRLDLKLAFTCTCIFYFILIYVGLPVQIASYVKSAVAVLYERKVEQ